MKNLLRSLILFTLLISQSGCILSLGSASLIAGKATLASIAAAVATCHAGRDSDCLTFGEIAVVTALASLVLDQSNPGRNDALNPLPVDEEFAHSLGVETIDLLEYNQELTHLLSINENLEKWIVQAPHVNSDEVARRLGLGNGKALVKVLEGDRLSSDILGAFARSQGLSLQTARLYLSLRFGIL